MTTPIAAAFHAQGQAVTIDTDHPMVYEGNPHAKLGKGTALDPVLDLDLSYELRPDLHAVDAYFLAAGIDGDRTIRYFPRTPQPSRSPYIAIHAAHSWESRTFPEYFWKELARNLPLPVVWLGGCKDFAEDNTMMNKPLPTTAAVIEAAEVFIGSDSALLHLAGATETPIVGLFTSVRADRRMPYRHGSRAWRAIGLEAEIVCRGCLEIEIIPSTELMCRRGDNQCVRSIDPAVVAYAAATLMPRVRRP